MVVRWTRLRPFTTVTSSCCSTKPVSLVDISSRRQFSTVANNCTTFKYYDDDGRSSSLPTFVRGQQRQLQKTLSFSTNTSTSAAASPSNHSVRAQPQQPSQISPAVAFDPHQTYLLRISTYCRGPRGMSGAGFVLYKNKDSSPTNTDPLEEVWSGGLYYSCHPHSYNWLETAYAALCELFESLRTMGVKRLHLESSSTILIRQIQGQYKVVSKRLLKLFWRTMKYVEVGFDHVVPLQYVSPTQNKRADELAKQVVGMRQSCITQGLVLPTTAHHPQHHTASYATATCNTSTSCNSHGQEQSRDIPIVPTNNSIHNNHTTTPSRFKNNDMGTSSSSKFPIQLTSSNSPQSSIRSKIDPSKTYLLRIDGGLRKSILGGVGMVLYEHKEENNNVPRRKTSPSKKKKEVWCGWKPLYFDDYNWKQQQQDEYDAVVFHNHLYEPDANVCEYKAMLLAIQYMAKIGVRNLCVESDSLLLVRQIQRGVSPSEVNNFKLRLLHGAVMDQIHMLDHVHVKHIRRYRNTRADGLVRQAMDTLCSHGFEEDL